MRKQMQTINNYSKNDIKKIVDEAIEKRVIPLEKIISTLRIKIIDIERIIGK